MMTGEEARAFLEGLAPSSIRLGLDRMQAALRALKSPERDFPAVHVAGTNGKGSTCAMIASVLAAQGLRVGLYTSPHLERFHERIRISGSEGLEPIADETLGRRVGEVLERYPGASQAPSPLSYFEFGTLLAFWHFSREEVDVAVVETGLGGRLDATTCCQPVVTAITPVALDHMELLGQTLASIAHEKAGILKPGVPAVLARQAPEVQAVLEARAREVGAPLVREGVEFAIRAEALGSALVYQGPVSTHPRLTLGLRGEHQRQNAAVALACLGQLSHSGIRVQTDAVREGLLLARWPGRLEEVAQSPTLVLDGAHNPHGIQALMRAMETEYAGRPVHAVFGVLGDKDVRPMMRHLFPRCASVTLVRPPSERGWDPDRFVEEARGLCSEVTVAQRPAEALRIARLRAEARGLVLGCGSLVLIGALRSLVVEPTRHT